MVVVPDTPQKRAAYEEQVIRTFYVSHANVASARPRAHVVRRIIEACPPRRRTRGVLIEVCSNRVREVSVDERDEAEPHAGGDAFSNFVLRAIYFLTSTARFFSPCVVRRGERLRLPKPNLSMVQSLREGTQRLPPSHNRFTMYGPSSSYPSLR